MDRIKIELQNTESFINKTQFKEYKNRALVQLEKLEARNGKGSAFLGWLDLPYTQDLDKIKLSVKKFKELVDTIVVVGIGGSYLGARAVITSLTNSFEKISPEILFAGNSLDEVYHIELLDYLKDKNFGIIVISKSGTTTEPAISFRFLKDLLEKKYDKEDVSQRIIAITDKKRGALKKLADIEKYETFIIPDDVGGRFSILSPVGLIPLALAGVDIDELIRGAKSIDIATRSNIEFEQNPVLKYSATRNSLYNEGKKIELLTSYNPKFLYLIEWWKQLYGESEGKENKGIFPAGIINTTDLHSMGQYIQDGERILFETIISVEQIEGELKISKTIENLDNLNYLYGKRVSEVNKKAMEGTTLAHLEGGVPNIKILLPKLNEYYMGQLLFFFEKACAVSGYILGVNPFDQPGVEAYKSKMFELLGKPK